jgi:cytoskeletal protein CcmA (bactofilin family)
LIVQGYVEGSVEADRVDIKTAGHVNGEITAIELVIESKGVFEGNSIVKNSSKQAVLEQNPSVKKA